VKIRQYGFRPLETVGTNPAEGKRSGGAGSLSSGDPERIRWEMALLFPPQEI